MRLGMFRIALKEALNNCHSVAPASWEPLRYQGSMGRGSGFSELP